MRMDELTGEIRLWAIERNLHKGDPYKQALKMSEEFGEFCEAMVKKRRMDMYDGIGDMYVVLTILSMMLDVNIEYCVNLAYDEIKDRKGKLIEGVFIKEGDLK